MICWVLALIVGIIGLMLVCALYRENYKYVDLQKEIEELRKNTKPEGCDVYPNNNAIQCSGNPNQCLNYNKVYPKYTIESNSPYQYVVPAGTMKVSNERFRNMATPEQAIQENIILPYHIQDITSDPSLYASKVLLPAVGAVKPPLQPDFIRSNFTYSDRPIVSHDFFKPYGRNESLHDIPFFTSASAFAPFPRVNSEWEKIGILTPLDHNEKEHRDQILNLYRRPIAPLQDLWQYSVQDAKGFVIPLKTTGYLENGDIIGKITGKPDVEKWKAHIYINNQFVWMS